MPTDNTSSHDNCTNTSTNYSVSMLPRSRRSQVSTSVHTRINGQAVPTANNSTSNSANYHSVQMLSRIHRSKMPTANHPKAHSATNYSG